MISTKHIAQLLILALGAIMTLVGLASIFTGNSRPELATAGISAIMTSGLIGTVGKDDDER